MSRDIRYLSAAYGLDHIRSIEEADYTMYTISQRDRQDWQRYSGTTTENLEVDVRPEARDEA